MKKIYIKIQVLVYYVQTLKLVFQINAYCSTVEKSSLLNSCFYLKLELREVFETCLSNRKTLKTDRRTTETIDYNNFKSGTTLQFSQGIEKLFSHIIQKKNYFSLGTGSCFSGKI